MQDTSFVMSPFHIQQSCFRGSIGEFLRPGAAAGYLSVLMFTAGLSSIHAQTIQEQASAQSRLVQFEPTTSAGLIEVAQIAEKLKRSSDAKRYLRALLDAQPGADELQNLQTRFGMGIFLAFNANSDLQPEARELLKAVNEASKDYAPSDVRLQELTQQLDSNSDKTTSAIMEILSTEDRAAAPLLAVAPNTPQGRTADQILHRHARVMRRGLLAAMDTADDVDRQRILRFLSTTGDTQFGRYLYRWRFADDISAEVKTAAQMSIEKLAGGNRPVALNDRLPATAEEAVSALCTAARAALRESRYQFPNTTVDGVAQTKSAEEQKELVAAAMNLAQDAVTIRPDDITALSLLLVSQSSSDPVQLATPDTEFTDKSMDIRLAALRESLSLQIPQSSIRMLQSVSQDLSSESAEVSTDLLLSVKLAISSPDPRVRLLASQLQLTAGFQTLNNTASKRNVQAAKDGTLSPEAVVIDANADRLPGLAAMLSDEGLVVATSRSGADGFSAAVQQMHCELILINSHCMRWDLTSTIANIRADIRTRNCPIVVYGPANDLHYVRSLSKRYPGVWFMPEPFGHLTAAELDTLQRSLQDPEARPEVNTELTIMQRLRNAGVPVPLLSPADRHAMSQIAASL